MPMNPLAMLFCDTINLNADEEREYRAGVFYSHNGGMGYND